jgi:hypothetical protein
MVVLLRKSIPCGAIVDIAREICILGQVTSCAIGAWFAA